MKINNIEIGQRIRKERENLNLTREDFAGIISLSDYYIGQLERGERQMSLPALVNIANCLHVSLDYLIFGGSKHSDYPINDTQNEYSSLYSSDEYNKNIEQNKKKELYEVNHMNFREQI